MQNLTANQIVTRALEIAGNPNLTDTSKQALVWLEELIDEELQDRDWVHVLQETSVTPASSTIPAVYSFPALTLWSLSAVARIGNAIRDGWICYQESNSTSWHPVELRGWAKYLDLRDRDTGTGAPKYIFCHPTQSKYALYPILDRTITLKFWLFPMLSTALLGTTTIIWPEPSYIIQRLVERVYQHQDDKRLVMQKMVVKDQRRNLRAGLEDTAVEYPDLPLNPRIFKWPGKQSADDDT